MHHDKKRLMNSCTVSVLACLLLCTLLTSAQQTATARQQTITTISSTIPSNGDLNPYGVFVSRALWGSFAEATFWSATSTTAAICKVRERPWCKSLPRETSAYSLRSIPPRCLGPVREGWV